MTRQQLADAVGVSKTSVHHWESGEHPKVGNVYKIASVLNVSPRQIIGDGDGADDKQAEA